MAEITMIKCDECLKIIPKPDMAIHLEKGDLDVHGIWFGDVKRWLWFDSEYFCSLNCLLKYIRSWHKEYKNDR